MGQQVNKPASKGGEQAPNTTKPKDLTKKGEELKEALDEVKDEIDALLDDIDQAMADTLGETNVEDFINGYVQRGGE